MPSGGSYVLSRGGTPGGAGLKFLDSLEPWTGTYKSMPSLEGMRRLMLALGNPQDSVPAIHVAGTNGKGSVSVAIAAILGASGYQVGLTTSPHLISVHERIVVNGKPVDDEILDWALLEVSRAAALAQISPTHFEALTAAAFVVFANANLDFIVVEVGLGGRLDATNVIKQPRVGVITTIDYDHEAILGATLAKIAAEKAGIIKAGMLLVVGGMADEASVVIDEVARGRGIDLVRFDKHFGLRDRLYWSSRSPISQIRIEPSLEGEYQLHNMALAIQACLLLGVMPHVCEQAVKSVRWPGRLETVVWQGRQLLLDAAHNPQGIRSFATYVRSRGLHGLPMIFGVLDTKNWRAMLRELSQVVGEFIVVRPDFPTALACSAIVDELSCTDIKATSYEHDYESALQAAVNSGAPVTGVVGSIYLIGKIRQMCGAALPHLWEHGGLIRDK